MTRSEIVELARQEGRAAAREELRRLLARALADDRVYSSRKGHGPPGYSDEAWKEIAKRIGTRRGRWHVVTQEQLDALERGDRDVKPANDPPGAWHPSQTLTAVGRRLVGGAK